MGIEGVFGNVPIVGTPVDIHVSTVLSSYTCKCSSGNTPQMVTGLQFGSACLVCKNVYGIVAVSFDREKIEEGLSVSIGIVGRLP